MGFYGKRADSGKNINRIEAGNLVLGADTTTGGADSGEMSEKTSEKTSTELKGET